MFRIHQIKLPIKHTREELEEKICKIVQIKQSDLITYEIIKKSIDARKKPIIFYLYVIDIETKVESSIEKKVVGNYIAAIHQVQSIDKSLYQFGTKGNEKLKEPPIIVGAGPAGLFCAYFLAREGYQPILLERGKDVERRQKDVELFWESGELNKESNVQFGEGGAGTFSDGKLNTLTKDKDGKNREVLRILVECGAPKEIMFEAKPHVGTDILSKVVMQMRKKILAWGGAIRFEQKVTDLKIDNQQQQILGVEINGHEFLSTKQVILAIGHSARDTFSMLNHKGLAMEGKSFAVGFRIEHLQNMIDTSQYGSCDMQYLPKATYKLTNTASNQRGVYTFCMCPGGYVVNASSEEKRLVINGMSYAKRDSNNANSAIVVTVTPEDFQGKSPLAGVEFQRQLEEKAFILGQGRIPVQRYREFKQCVEGNTHAYIPLTNTHLEPCMKGLWQYADLSGLLPKECNKALIEGIEHFGKKIQGFSQDDALLSGIESRTSSPVRIIRDQDFMSNIKGIYPCGEGAGYAGGITSAAMDGMKIAEKIGKLYAPLTIE